MDCELSNFNFNHHIMKCSPIAHIGFTTFAQQVGRTPLRQPPAVADSYTTL